MENIEWYAFSRPAEGENVCGDQHLLQITPGGFIAAIADGLGHGLEAAEASRTAIACIAQNPTEELPVLARRCHQALIGTRGVVLGLCRYAERQSRWETLVIGNISLRILSGKNLHPISRGGISGYKFPSTLQVNTWPSQSKDVLIMHSDGIKEDFTLGIYASNTRYHFRWATDLMAGTLGKINDDATIITVRLNQEA